MDMKRGFLAVALFVVIAVGVDYYVSHKDDDQPYLEQLKHTIECADWQVYRNADYGYEMRHLSCFSQRNVDGVEGMSFVYEEDVSLQERVCYITQEVHTEICKDSLNPDEEIEKRAKQLGAQLQKEADGIYLMSGKRDSLDKRITAYQYNVKFVLRQHIWFVHAVIYPEDFAPSVGRLVEEVKAWKPFA